MSLLDTLPPFLAASCILAIALIKFSLSLIFIIIFPAVTFGIFITANLPSSHTTCAEPTPEEVNSTFIASSKPTSLKFDLNLSFTDLISLPSAYVSVNILFILLVSGGVTLIASNSIGESRLL